MLWQKTPFKIHKFFLYKIRIHTVKSFPVAAPEFFTNTSIGKNGNHQIIYTNSKVKFSQKK